MMESIALTVKQAKTGDKEAFSTLYSYYYKDMYKYALYMLKNIHDVEDVISETVIDAYQGIVSLKKEESFKFWLFKILLAKVKRKLKVYATTKTCELEENYIVIDDLEYDLNTDLKNALNQLDSDKKSIVLLSVLGGYKSKEIAVILEKNASTVRTELSRSLKKLQTILS